MHVPDDVVLKHSRESIRGSEARKDTYFDILKLKSPERLKPKPVVAGEGGEEGEGEEEGRVSKLFKTVVDFLIDLLDDLNEWLEQNSALFREVVEAVQEGSEEGGSTAEKMSPLSPTPGAVSTYGAASDHAGADVAPGDDGGIAPAAEGGSGEGGARGRTAAEPKDGVVTFDQRGDLLEKHIGPSAQARQDTEAYEEELKKQANQYTRRFTRLGRALYYVFLSNNQYVPFFFIILSIIVNGSLLSLFYAVLLFSWGLLSVPWPSKRFWLTLIFYTMFVLVVKYAFQFHDIDYWMKFDSDSGLYPPRLIGIERRNSFVGNAVVDILLLTFLLIHRGLLFVRTRDI